MASRMGRKELRRQLAASERQAKVIDLYMQGWSYRRIAAELGYAGPSSVKKAIEGAIAKAPSRSVNELRAEIDERARRILAELFPIVIAKRGDFEKKVAAVDRIIKIDKELRAMHGVDAPETTVQLNAEMPSKDVRQQILDRLTRLTDAAAASEGPKSAK